MRCSVSVRGVLRATASAVGHLSAVRALRNLNPHHLAGPFDAPALAPLGQDGGLPKSGRGTQGDDGAHQRPQRARQAPESALPTTTASPGSGLRS